MSLKTDYVVPYLFQISNLTDIYKNDTEKS